MCRSPPGTPTRAPPCATTGRGRTSTGTPTTSSPPAWHRGPDRRAGQPRCLADEWMARCDTHRSALSPVRSGMIAWTSLAHTRSPKRMTRHEFRLSFSLIECAGCGGQRVRGVACAGCGRRPAGWEVDVKLQRRQAVAEELLAAARGGILSQASFLTRLRAWPFALASTCQPFIRGFGRRGFGVCCRRRRGARRNEREAASTRSIRGCWSTARGPRSEPSADATATAAALGGDRPNRRPDGARCPFPLRLRLEDPKLRCVAFGRQ
jgi:hypothetical protein